MTDSSSAENATMTAMQSPEQLLEIIRKEARYLQAQEEIVLQPGVEPETKAFSLPVWEASPDPFPVKSIYHCNEFLVYDDLEFVINAYRGILQREPDESGLDRYTMLLRTGGDKAKYEILIALLLCDEGREKGVKIQGMRWEIWERSFAGRRWFFYPLKVLFSLLKSRLKNDQQQYALDNMRKARNWQHKLNTFIFEQQRQLQYIDGREKNIECSYKKIDDQLARYRSELLLARQDLLLQQQRLNVLLEDITETVEPPMPEDIHRRAKLATHASEKFDAFYLAFENECRGEEDEIRRQLTFYLDKLTDAAIVNDKRPLLDIGCGRGEWLGLLKTSGFAATGVDISQVLVEYCKNAGHDVVLADGIEHLKSLPDSSLGAVSAFHLIEHLPFDALYNLVEQSHRLLAPGGLLIFETPNPENVLVGSHTFYHDPTHRNPITPTLIDFLVRYLGFVDVQIERLHPYPDEAKVIGIDVLTERFNGHFCGPQDFAVIATKPKAHQG